MGNKVSLEENLIELRIVSKQASVRVSPWHRFRECSTAQGFITYMHSPSFDFVSYITLTTSFLTLACSSTMSSITDGAVVKEMRKE